MKLIAIMLALGLTLGLTLGACELLQPTCEHGQTTNCHQSW